MAAIQHGLKAEVIIVVLWVSLAGLGYIGLPDMDPQVLNLARNLGPNLHLIRILLKPQSSNHK
jgi:hypothetical protein